VHAARGDWAAADAIVVGSRWDPLRAETRVAELVARELEAAGEPARAARARRLGR
jgi:hypothetical protein